ncbi:hypothetical protein [Aureimonas altamirensis]|uniref:hypothetical protein n=1 Tax=Aureimonas altamirensis TaxID=370622 RepID=UPI00301B3FC4
MARSSVKASKSETLTIRLDPKTRFVLEYLSRLKGQTITTVVERAIVQAATAEKIEHADDPRDEQNWQDFWDVSEGARAIKIARRSEFFPTFEEEKRVAFCEEHWPFFFINSNKRIFRYPYLDILWPRIDDFITLHDMAKTSSGASYWAAGEAMQEALGQAGIKPPAWPQGTSAKNAKPDLDDEIPF